MALTNKTQIDQRVATTFATLPSTYPPLPEDVTERFPSLKDWEGEQTRLLKRVQEALDSVNADLGMPISEVKTSQDNLKKTLDTAFGTLSTRIDTLEQTYVTPDGALALRTTNLEASVNGTSSSPGLLARMTSVEGAKVDASGAYAQAITAISASLTSGASGSIGAAVTAEANARALADGNLSGKYTLKVTAGGAVAGMNITATSSGGTDTSDITFLADAFRIYNGTTGAAPFQVIGGQVRINSGLVITSSDVSGLGTLATKSTVAWSTDLTGRPVELTDGRISTALNSSGTVVARVVPASLASPGASGLYLGSDRMGFYNGSIWKSYMDNSGNFYLAGTGYNALAWDGSTLTVRGNLKVSDGTSLGSLAIKNTVAWSSDVDGRPSELTDGRVAVALNSSGTVVSKVVPASLASPGASGLYLGSDRMGFYDGGTWKSYMDSSGNFYLAGSSYNALSWDGTTLTVRGNLKVSDGTSLGSLALKSSVDLATADVTNKSLANVDSTANTKLAGISSGADVTLTAINGGLTITSGGLTLNGTPSIKSNNYVAGSAGWAIKGDGTVEFSSGTFRSTIDVGTGDARFYKAATGATTFGDTTKGYIALENFSSGTAAVRAKYGSNTKVELRAQAAGSDFVGALYAYSSDNLTYLSILGAITAGSAPVISWNGDTNLYRYTSGKLKTDGGFIFGGGCTLTQQVAKSEVFVLSGGSAEETFNVNISGNGFTAKPTAGLCNCSSDTGYTARYDWDAAGNSSTNAVVKVYRYDGTSTGGGARRFSLVFFQ